MNKNVQDLSKAKGTYTRELEDHIKEIYAGYETKTTEELRQLIISIVSKANDTPARKGFLLSLAKQRTKDDMLMLASNAYLRGCGMSSNIYDKFNR